MKHTKDIGKFGQPKTYTTPNLGSGYPNNVPNTQTVKTRGTGAAVKGNSSSTKLG